MPTYSNPYPPTEVASWGNTEILANGVKIWFVKGFKEPDVTTNIISVYGQGIEPVGYAVGRVDYGTGTLTFLPAGFNQFISDLPNIQAGDPINNSNILRNIIQITVSELPADGNIYSNSIRIYPSVKITGWTRSEHTEGQQEKTVTLNLMFFTEPQIFIGGPGLENNITP